ncbi:MAG: HPr family phosphocarrier protein [Lachnospiraceae bacterium]|nr:HPr family phosphocarrier protein [Lachnospiraceae bacterium]
MKKLINLANVEEANRFVNLANHFSGNIDLKVGSHILDAKSLLGVISMAVGKTGELFIMGGEEDPSALSDILAFCE